jgi:hypothetical protein
MHHITNGMIELLEIRAINLLMEISTSVQILIDVNSMLVRTAASDQVNVVHGATHHHHRRLVFLCCNDKSNNEQ